MTNKKLIITITSVLLTIITITAGIVVAVKYLPKSEDAKEQKKDKTTTKKSLKDTNNKKLKTY